MRVGMNHWERKRMGLERHLLRRKPMKKHWLRVCTSHLPALVAVRSVDGSGERCLDNVVDGLTTVGRVDEFHALNDDDDDDDDDGRVEADDNEVDWLLVRVGVAGSNGDVGIGSSDDDDRDDRVEGNDTASGDDDDNDDDAEGACVSKEAEDETV